MSQRIKLEVNIYIQVFYTQKIIDQELQFILHSIRPSSKKNKNQLFKYLYFRFWLHLCYRLRYIAKKRCPPRFLYKFCYFQSFYNKYDFSSSCERAYKQEILKKQLLTLLQDINGIFPTSFSICTLFKQTRTEDKEGKKVERKVQSSKIKKE